MVLLTHCPCCHTEINRDTKKQPINPLVKGYERVSKKEFVCKVCGTTFKVTK
jgi:uncharacterized protein YbaR (Trm112 family)